jgi:hypothetical protein
MPRLLVLVCAIALCAACSEPPQKELDRAQGAIEAAQAAGAERYATAEYTAATTSLQQAHAAVAEGDYRLALSRALDASERAQQSARQAADGKARARSEAEVRAATTATAIQQLRSALKAAESARVSGDVAAASRQVASSSDAALQKARALVAREQYLDAIAALKGVDERIQAQMQALTEAQKVRGARKRD